MCWLYRSRGRLVPRSCPPACSCLPPWLPTCCIRALRLLALVQVLHNGRVSTVNSTELLPGDVVVLHPGILPCDLALVRCDRRRCPLPAVLRAWDGLRTALCCQLPAALRSAQGGLQA